MQGSSPHNNTSTALLHPRMAKRACKTIIEPELLTGTLGSFACRSLAHCPSKDFGTWVRVNSMVDTFQTRNGHLWLLSLREGQLDLLFEAAAARGAAWRPGRAIMGGAPSQQATITGGSWQLIIHACILVRVSSTWGSAGSWATAVPRSLATPALPPCTGSLGGGGLA